MRDATHWATIVDPAWHIVYTTDDLRLAGGFMIERSPSLVGLYMFGSECLNEQAGWPGGAVTVEGAQAQLAVVGDWVLEDAPGGRDALRALVDPRLRDIVDQLGT